MQKLYVTKNLTDTEPVESCPWEWEPDPELLDKIRSMPKELRKSFLRSKKTKWNVYCTFRGVAPRQIISDENPAYGGRAFAVDFDAKYTWDAFQGRLEEMPKGIHPTFFEQSLSGNVRLVWMFPEEVVFRSTQFATVFLKKLGQRLQLPKWLPGIDDKTYDPRMRWSNGVDWYEVTGEPLDMEIVKGSYMEASKDKSLYEAVTIPIETVAEEVERRWPGRWQGEFIEEATGVRFWDETADNQNGCQVKPDGMLCFTGIEKHGPFMKWEQLFDREFIQKNTKDRLAAAADGIYYDSKNYWRYVDGQGWTSRLKDSIKLHLALQGVSSKKGKGQIASEMDQVLGYIEEHQAIIGAAPFINYPPGIVQQGELRFLNNSALKFPEPIKGATGTPKDFPFIWELLKIFGDGLEHLLAWTRRFHVGLVTHEQVQGQAIFLCGPTESGKSLIINHFFVPLFGGLWSNPYNYLNGSSQFSDFVFDAPTLVLDDQVSPQTWGAKSAFNVRLKNMIAQPGQISHAKFSKPVKIIWIGRLIGSLNDDPESLGMLPLLSEGLADKLMFFKIEKRRKDWPSNKECEEVMAKEMPHFLWWLLNVFDDSKVRANNRMGVKCYYDPRIVRFSEKQHQSASMSEILALFAKEMYADAKVDNQPEPIQVMSPTELLHELDALDGYQHVLKEWTSERTYKALQHLARNPKESGIEQLDAGFRTFKIDLEFLASKRQLPTSK